jgi:F-type H+-transporting ATPase subunit epsilon
MGMRVEVVTPEKVIFSGECTQVATRTLGGGEIAFLEGHAPFLGALSSGHTKIWLVDGTVVNVAVHGGFVEVGPHGVSILSDEAELGTDIDIARAQAAKDRAEERLRQEQDAEAVGALSRAHARLAAAGGIPQVR